MKKVLIISMLAGLAAAPPALAQTTGATINPTTPPISSPSANISRAGESYGPGVIISRSSKARGLSSHSVRARRNSMPSHSTGTRGMLGDRRR
jgi:hypothetical protein